MPNATVTTNAATEQIESCILRKRGLELGFEGDRWYDIIRIARWRGAQYLNGRVKKRIPVTGHARIETKLADTSNQYPPYNAWKNA